MAKTCFLVFTNYDEGTKEYQIADEKFHLLIKPVLDELSYQCTRADERYQVGVITQKTIKELINSDLVIFDISDFNPNIFYELAIRNAIKKPVIILKAPFQGQLYDINQDYVISFDMNNPDLWKRAKAKLATQILEVENNAKSSESILSEFGFSSNLIGKNPEFEFLSIVDDLKFEIKRLKSLEIPQNGKTKEKPSNEKLGIKCKNCQKIFPSKTQMDLEILERCDLQRFEKCSYCDHLARYHKENFLVLEKTEQ